MDIELSNIMSEGNQLWEKAEVTGYVNKKKHIPELMDKWFKFNKQGVTNRNMIIERTEGKLGIVPEAALGSPGYVAERDDESATSIIIPHFPMKDALLPQQFAGIRETGTALEKTVAGERNKVLDRLDRHNRLLWEIGRVGAMTGLLMGATKTGQIVVRKNWYNTFRDKSDQPLVQSTASINFAAGATNIRSTLVGVRNQSEDNLGDLTAVRYVAVCGKNRFGTITDHPKFEKAFERYNDGQALRDNLEIDGFQIGNDIYVVKYHRATVAGLTLIGDDDMYMVPVVDEGFFETRFAPGSGFSDLGSKGLPQYVSTKILDHDEGVEFKGQTNFASWCSRLESIVKVSQS